VCAKFFQHNGRGGMKKYWNGWDRREYHIPCSRVLLEKLTGSQLVKKFPAVYGPWRFITRIRKCPSLVPNPSKLDPVHTPTSHFLNIYLNIILNLCLGLPRGAFPSGYPTPDLCMPLLSRTRSTCSTHLILIDFITWTTVGSTGKYHTNCKNN
jgi:hypothetical protein